MDKRTLSVADIESQAILTLPSRELMHSGWHLIIVDVKNIDILTGILNNSLNNFEINVLNGNDVNVTVKDNLNNLEVTVLCNQIVAVVASQCTGRKGH